MSGGSSKSSTKTSSTDARQVLDGGSIGTTASPGAAQGNTAVALTSSTGNTVTVTDAGISAAALESVNKVVESTNALIKAAIEDANNLVKDITGDTNQFQETQGAVLATAYTDSKGTKDVLVIGALLIGGVAIAYMLRK